MPTAKIGNGQTTYTELTRDSTGSLSVTQDSTIIVPFERYELVLQVSGDGKLLNVLEVRIKKDFLTDQQRLAKAQSFDVDKFYQE